MKTAAIAACSKLAFWLFESGENHITWRRADRIERRFKCVGCTSAFLDRLKSQYRDALAQDALRHNAKNPDRLTYLYR